MQTLYEQDNAWEFNDKELQRLGIDYQGKAILAVRADLWFPYSSANVTVSVAYYLKGDSTPHYIRKISAGKPYPNKGILSAVQRIGRKKTKEFIPIVFDNLKELKQVKKVEIFWTVIGDETTDFAEYILAEYPVTFAEPEQKFIYGLHSYEIIPNDIIKKSMDKDSSLEEMIQQSFSEKNGKIINSNGSEYDDVCFYLFDNERLYKIKEMHYESKNLPLLKNLLAIAYSGMKQEKINAGLISYYRTSTKLNDKEVIAV